MPGARINPGQIANQRVITTDLDDVVGNGNALFPMKGSGAYYATAILVSGNPTDAGAVKIRYADGRDETIPQVAPGVWVGMMPFSHVWSTGTTADAVTVGMTR